MMTAYFVERERPFHDASPGKEFCFRSLSANGWSGFAARLAGGFPLTEASTQESFAVPATIVSTASACPHARTGNEGTAKRSVSAASTSKLQSLHLGRGGHTRPAASVGTGPTGPRPTSPKQASSSTTVTCLVRCPVKVEPSVSGMNGVVHGLWGQ